jgi:hypothetical protein
MEQRHWLFEKPLASEIYASWAQQVDLQAVGHGPAADLWDHTEADFEVARVESYRWNELEGYINIPGYWTQVKKFF